MALSETTVDALEVAKVSIEEYLATRTSEIDDLVLNLKAYGVPLDSLSIGTTDAATDEAMVAISTLLGG